jgi:hypothetical protein
MQGAIRGLMRIKFEIPQNGYKAQIADASAAGRFDEWAYEKFIKPVRGMVDGNYSYEITQPTHIIIDFADDADADVFLTIFGGREIDE